MACLFKEETEGNSKYFGYIFKSFLCFGFCIFLRKLCCRT